jgi:hypothetical protein
MTRVDADDSKHALAPNDFAVLAKPSNRNPNFHRRLSTRETRAPFLDRTCLDLTGLDLTGLDLTGLDLTGLDGTGLKGLRLAPPFRFVAAIPPPKRDPNSVKPRWGKHLG